MSKIKLRIDKIVPKVLAQPLICTFVNGEPTEQFDSAECEMYFNYKKQCVATVIDDILYEGTEEDNEDIDQQTLIVARDRDTGKVRVIEYARAVLEPKLGIDKLDSTELNRRNAVTEPADDLGFSRKFGSKTQKKQLEKQEKQKTNKDIMEDQLQNYVQDLSKNETVNADKLDISSFLKSQTNDYIPPINRDATKVDDVYDPKAILSEDLYEKIYNEIQNKNYKGELLPYMEKFYATNMSSMHLVLLMYANSLMKLYLAMSKDILKKNFSVCDSSVTLDKTILENFTLVVNNKRTRPNTLRDKALCYVVVVLLILNNFQLDLSDFMACVKLAAMTVTNKVRVVGAYVIKSGDKKYIQLKLPLNSEGNRRRKSAKF